jgi:hypothetical protein
MIYYYISLATFIFSLLVALIGIVTGILLVFKARKQKEF